jgi:hypothetical protein
VLFPVGILGGQELCKEFDGKALPWLGRTFIETLRGASSDAYSRAARLLAKGHLLKWWLRWKRNPTQRPCGGPIPALA